MKETILLADDSVTIRKVVELTFMGESFELISVGSGTEAIDQLERGEGLDLVIADVHMPGADGYQVCKEVKRKSPSTPVLLLVGTFEQFDQHKAEEAGADDHLKKPFDSQDLLGRVRELLAQSAAGAPPAGAQSPSEEDVSPAPAEDAQVAASGSVRASAPVSETPAARPAAPVAEAPAPSPPASDHQSEIELSDESVDRIARRVVELLSEEAIREVAWEVIPDLAEVVIKERLNELESQVE